MKANYWTFMCCDDIGDGESGPLMHNYSMTVRADTVEAGAADLEQRGFLLCDNGRPATESEIDEFLYIEREEEEFFEKYGCSPYDEQMGE